MSTTPPLMRGLPSKSVVSPPVRLLLPALMAGDKSGGPCKCRPLVNLGSKLMFPGPLLNRAPLGTPPWTSLYCTTTAGPGDDDWLDASNSPPPSFHRMLLLTWTKLVPSEPKSSEIAPPADAALLVNVLLFTVV